MSSDNQITRFKDQLSACAIVDIPQAVKNLESLKNLLGDDGFSFLLPLIAPALPRVADPDMALNNLDRFVSSLQDVASFLEASRSRSQLLATILTVFGASRFLSAHLCAAADEYVVRLSHSSYLSQPAEKNRVAGRLAETLRSGTTEQEFLRGLRLFRKQEMLRIALRDLLRIADLSETVGELSDLAEVCLQACYERIYADLESKFGTPMTTEESGMKVKAAFAVIAMGKLGGRELNFSSDVDLMYVYTKDGETDGAVTGDGIAASRITNHEFFVKLAEKLSAAIGQKTEDGFVFRVDLRLRPEGQSGPLVQSLGGYEIYYESWGQTWERAALIKARPVAGDIAAGREFVERITPFVYRKYLDYGAIVEIRDMKQKINGEVRQKGREHRDVKLGYGGIREIEFLVQSLQLIFGGRDRSLREPGTLRALHALSQKGLLTYEETAELNRAYVFLRTVEHRIQVLNDLQSQTMPSDREGLRALARRAGYLEHGGEIDALLRDYVRHTDAVRRIYDNLLLQTGAEAGAVSGEATFGVLLDPETGESEALAALSTYGFRDPPRAYRNLRLLREGEAFVHQTPRSRRIFGELFPLLFRELIASPDPDKALNHLESFFAVQGSWEAFQAFAKQDPRLVKVLTAIFANSDYFSRMLVRSPGILSDLLDTGRPFNLGSAAVMRNDLDTALSKADGLPERLDSLRRFKHREEMRIGMADLLSDIPMPAVSKSLSRLADACLDSALDLAAAEIGKRYGTRGSIAGLAVIAAGKLGGRELTYGSDLDILFVFSEEHAGPPPAGSTLFEYFNRIGEKTLSYLTTMTREGFVYRVDTRLRPGGSKGPLVQSVTAFRNYYASQAATWERQSLVNTRAAAGDLETGRVFLCAMEELIFRDAGQAELAKDVLAMRKRMEEELGKEDANKYNIKQGRGGLVDIEFLAQFLQLLHGRKRKRLRIPGTVNALHALRYEGLLSPEDARVLRDAYFFIRLLEGRMRIVTNQATHELSRDAEKLRSLARRAGYEDDALTAGEKLIRNYERMRQQVRNVFERVVREI